MSSQTHFAFDFAATTEGPLVLDVETQFLSSEVPGGWNAIESLKVALVVTWDEKMGLRTWFEKDTGMLLEELKKYDPIVTFNGERFDFKVLSAYGSVSSLYPKSTDMLVALTKKLGFRVKLESLALATLGRGKTGSGTESVRWWRSEDPVLRQKAIDYCKDDVELTRDLYLFGKKHGYVLINDLKTSSVRRVDIQW
jgi:DEAD/DEAH box helicase domain-containing protein